MTSRRVRDAGARLLALFATLVVEDARALPGTHAPAISTYDTRASSVVFAYRHAESDAGPFNTFSYNANFSSTTGKLSAQFGIHYLNFAPKNGDSKAHGVGASGTALFVIPVGGRYDDGVPKAALAFDIGVVPSAYISGQRNFLTLPLVLGFGIPLSPAPALTITPWYELSPSVNLDTYFHPADITVDPNAVTIDPKTGQVSLPESAVRSAVEKGVSVDLGVSVPMRTGLEVAFHVAQSVDLNLYGAFATLGGGFSGSQTFTLGAGLVFRWDDVVSAVLPVERRLDREGCDAIEGRFRSCPNSRKWLTPEQRQRPSPAPYAPAPAPYTPQPAPYTRPPNPTIAPPPARALPPAVPSPPQPSAPSGRAFPPAPPAPAPVAPSAHESTPPAPASERAPPSAAFPN
ncbi:MAG TPA: hypothetical protein VGI10_18065 [Polyangiaceae bacterium]